MILADKITALRKKAGWSQEELAEQLGVTRQSVSKWEGAQSVPDMDKVVQMSRLFGVTTDFLLKDELSEEEPAPEGCVNHSAMQALLEEEDYTRENKAKSPVIGAVSGIYWLLVTAVYLFYTFGPMGNGQPKYSWFIWAVAGVLFGAVMLVVKLIARRK
ncbi:MAG: helix-turn-helix transcriptional regulator [Oscillospiraceae bacterium]|jgi:transcriptional regulator with XRE-family HTH domain|nr:helix-turn-helix transcriptional regulator [Bacillota bacterium]MDY6366042.1 helix-turn-helix transcriptional regulator [Oscillospiraceae bacterium]